MPSSPLAISNIVLSQSEREAEADAAPKASYYRDVLQPNAVPVLLRVRRARVAVVALAGAAAVAGLTFALARGVTLRTFATSDADEIATRAQREELVQDYNAYVAMAAALAVRPLQLLGAVVLPVWFWSFLTDKAMLAATADGSTKTKALVYGCSLALVWLLSSATHGLNVQLAFVHQPTRISSGLGFTSIANATQPGSSVVPTDESRVVDSILRSAVTMDYRSARSTCARASPQRIPAMIEYGFPSRAWMLDVATTASNATTTSQSQVQTSLTPPAAAFPTTPLPMEQDAARGLAAYAFPLMAEMLLSSIEKATLSINASDLVQDVLPDASTTVVTAGEEDNLWQGINASFHKFIAASAATRTSWFDVANTNVSVTAANLSSGFVVESMSFEIPFFPEYMQRRLTLTGNDTTSSVSYNNTNSSNTGALDYYFDINIKEECGEHACIVSPRSEKASDAPADNGPQIRALPICLDADGREDIRATLKWNASACSTVSSTSLIFISFAQRVEGESFSQPSSNVVRLKNAKKYYAVTVGRLRWSTVEVSVDGCASDSECKGASFQWKEDAAIAASQAQLPLNDLLSTSASASSWTTLVATSAFEIDAGANLKGDLIFPAMFATSSPLDVKPTQCEVERGNLLTSVAKQHWYARHSNRYAASAALLWLFQNGGTVATTDGAASASSAGSATSDPQSEVVARLVMQVPRLSAVLTYSGCAVVLLLAVAVALFSKRHESRLEKHFTPFHLAQALVGASSPLVPAPALLHADLLNLGGELLTSSARLRDFDVVSLTLRHRTAPSSLIRVPRPPALTASGSSTSSFLANV